MQEMFYNCINLEYINMKNFKETNLLYEYNNMFKNVPDNIVFENQNMMKIFVYYQYL